jgi:hypothetical protein
MHWEYWSSVAKKDFPPKKKKLVVLVLWWGSIRWKPVSSANIETGIWAVGSEMYVPCYTRELYEKMPALFLLCLFEIPSLSSLSLNIALKSTRFRCGISRSNLQAANRAAAGRPWRVTTSSVSRIPGGHGKLQVLDFWIEPASSSLMSGRRRVLYVCQIVSILFFWTNTTLDPAPISG